jgi:hypothetical protein
MADGRQQRADGITTLNFELGTRNSKLKTQNRKLKTENSNPLNIVQ